MHNLLPIPHRKPECHQVGIIPNGLTSRQRHEPAFSPIGADPEGQACRGVLQPLQRPSLRSGPCRPSPPSGYRSAVAIGSMISFETSTGEWERIEISWLTRRPPLISNDIIFHRILQPILTDRCPKSHRSGHTAARNDYRFAIACPSASVENPNRQGQGPQLSTAAL